MVADYYEQVPHKWQCFKPFQKFARYQNRDQSFSIFVVVVVLLEIWFVLVFFLPLKMATSISTTAKPPTIQTTGLLNHIAVLSGAAVDAEWFTVLVSVVAPPSCARAHTLAVKLKNSKNNFEPVLINTFFIMVAIVISVNYLKMMPLDEAALKVFSRRRITNTGVSFTIYLGNTCLYGHVNL